MQMRKWFTRFPTILQACESIIEMLRGQYAHSVGCYSEAAFHYIEAAKVCSSNLILAVGTSSDLLPYSMWLDFLGIEIGIHLFSMCYKFLELLSCFC